MQTYLSVCSSHRGIPISINYWPKIDHKLANLNNAQFWSLSLTMKFEVIQKGMEIRGNNELSRHDPSLAAFPLSADPSMYPTSHI